MPAAHPAVIFSKTYCPYCDLAKNNLSAEGGKYEVIELDQRDDGSAIQAALAQLTGRRTVPNGEAMYLAWVHMIERA
jgi:glutaredoxin 3